MSGNAVMNVFVLEVRRVLRDELTYAGVAAFALLLGVGSWLYWQTLPPRAPGGRLFGEGYVLALAVCCHAGLARDRAQRFDMYLAANFVTPAALYCGKVLAALVLLVALAATSFLLALIASMGDAAYAIHYSLLFLLASLLVLPVVVLTELAVTTRFPWPLIVMAFFAFLAVYGRTGDLRPLLERLGFAGNVDLWPALLRSALAFGATAACYPLFRFRLGGPRLATGDGAP